MIPNSPLVLMCPKIHRCLVGMKDPKLIKDKDSTVHTTEYWSKRNPTVKPLNKSILHSKGSGGMFGLHLNIKHVFFHALSFVGY